MDYPEDRIRDTFDDRSEYQKNRTFFPIYKFANEEYVQEKSNAVHIVDLLFDKYSKLTSFDSVKYKQILSSVDGIEYINHVVAVEAIGRVLEGKKVNIIPSSKWKPLISKTWSKEEKMLATLRYDAMFLRYVTFFSNVFGNR